MVKVPFAYGSFIVWVAESGAEPGKHICAEVGLPIHGICLSFFPQKVDQVLKAEFKSSAESKPHDAIQAERVSEAETGNRERMETAGAQSCGQLPTQALLDHKTGSNQRSRGSYLLGLKESGRSSTTSSRVPFVSSRSRPPAAAPTPAPAPAPIPAPMAVLAAPPLAAPTPAPIAAPTALPMAADLPRPPELLISPSLPTFAFTSFSPATPATEATIGLLPFLVSISSNRRTISLLLD